MESIIQTFHIDWRLIIAQMVNFVIVVLVLWFFALKPLVQKMSERTKVVEKSLEEARQISENFKKAEQQTNAMISAARKDAMKIIEDAKAAAEKERAITAQNTKTEVEKIVMAGKSQINHEKEKMISEARGEIAKLSAMAASKILEKVVDKNIDKKIIEKSLEEIHANNDAN